MTEADPQRTRKSAITFQLLFVRKFGVFLCPSPLLCGRHLWKPPYQIPGRVLWVCLLRPAADFIKGAVGIGAAVEHADRAVLESAVLGARARVAGRGGSGENGVLSVPVSCVLKVQ